MDFFDVVQSVVPTKVFSSYDGSGNQVKAEVVQYDSEGVEVYEVLVQEDITAEEGDEIANILLAELNVENWDFEASTEY